MLFFGNDQLFVAGENALLIFNKDLALQQKISFAQPCEYLRSFCTSSKFLVFILQNESKVVYLYKREKVDDAYKEYATFISEKPITACTITEDESKFIYADKFGDVIERSLTDVESLTAKTGKLLIGQLSMITDLKLDKGNSKIWICDRDERIKVSCYPKTHIIHDFYLGHKNFISKLVFVKDDFFVSGGGDGYVNVWNIKTKERKELNIESLIEADDESGKKVNIIDIVRSTDQSTIFLIDELESKVFLLKTGKKLEDFKLNGFIDIPNGQVVKSAAYAFDALWLQTSDTSLRQAKCSKEGHWKLVDSIEESITKAISENELVFEKSFKKISTLRKDPNSPYYQKKRPKTEKSETDEDEPNEDED